MDNSETLHEEFKNELDAISHNEILDPRYRRKKLILWAVRTLITIALYVLFWKYHWVKWTLFITVPLNALSLFAMISSPYLLKRKIEQTKEKLNAANNFINERNNDGE